MSLSLWGIWRGFFTIFSFFFIHSFVFLSISEWTSKKVIFGNPILQQHKGIFQIDDPAQTGSHLQPHFSPPSPTLAAFPLQREKSMESEQSSHLYTDIMCGHEAKQFDSASEYTHTRPFTHIPHSACDAILFFIFCSNAKRSHQRKSGKNLSFRCDNAIIGKIKRYNRRYQFNGILTIVIASSTSVRNPQVVVFTKSNRFKSKGKHLCATWDAVATVTWIQPFQGFPKVIHVEIKMMIMAYRKCLLVKFTQVCGAQNSLPRIFLSLLLHCRRRHCLHSYPRRELLLSIHMIFGFESGFWYWINVVCYNYAYQCNSSCTIFGIALMSFFCLVSIVDASTVYCLRISVKVALTSSVSLAE